MAQLLGVLPAVLAEASAQHLAPTLASSHRPTTPALGHPVSWLASTGASTNVNIDIPTLTGIKNKSFENFQFLINMLHTYPLTM